MNKYTVVARAKHGWRKYIAALILAALLAGLPVLATNVPGPLSSLFVQTVYAGCSLGGSCG